MIRYSSETAAWTGGLLPLFGVNMLIQNDAGVLSRLRGTRAPPPEVCQTCERPWLAAMLGLLLAPNSPLTN